MNTTSTTPTNPGATTTARRTITPCYKVRETADTFTLRAYVPGVERSSVETTVDGENLTVVARRAWTAPREWTPLHQEIPESDYRLVVTLDSRVNREAVRAELSQGVLTLTLPKAETVKPRRIEIQG